MPTDAELLEALVEALDAEVPPEPPADRVAEVRELATRRATSERAFRAPWLAIAAAVVALLAGTAVGRFVGRDADEVAGTIEYDGAMVGPSGETSEVQLSVVATGIGRVIDLDTHALPILAVGEYYQVWFVGPGDSPDAPNRISAGTFHPDPDGRSDVQFAAAVNPELYPVVEVSAEPGDGNPAATGPVVLRAVIAP